MGAQIRRECANLNGGTVTRKYAGMLAQRSSRGSGAKLLCYLVRIVWSVDPFPGPLVARRRFCGNRKICVEVGLGNVIFESEPYAALERQ